MIERKVQVNIEPTPAELAHVFCNESSEYQAEFFNEVAKIVANWENHFVFQLQGVIEEKKLTPEGRAVMEWIGEYGEVLAQELQ